MRCDQIFIPNGTVLSEDDLWKWFLNIEHEIRNVNFSDFERDTFRRYYHDAGMLRTWRRAYFRRHYSDTLRRSVQFLFAGQHNPTILDLGCGFGTQSLLFSVLGARVIGVDVDTAAIDIALKRKTFYESILGREVQFETVMADAFTLSYPDKVDAIHSVFAFNMMQPSRLLLDHVLPVLSKGGKVCILDGNKNSLWKVSRWKSRALSPMEFEDELLKRGFEIAAHVGGVALPPLIWSVFPRQTLLPLDEILGKCWWFPISHQLFAYK